MNAILTVMFGPLQGKAIQLDDSEVSIGREDGNSLTIADQLLSRRHCLIKKTGEEFKIIDLDSRNGVLVNNIPIRNRVLRHGDQIIIGDSMFLFLLQEEKRFLPDSNLKEDMVAKSTTRLKRDEAWYAEPEQLRRFRGMDNRAAHDLSLLLEISSAIAAVRDLVVLSKTLLKLLFAALPAERCAVLLTDLTGEIESVHASSRSSDEASFALSNTVIQEAIQSRVALLCNDMRHNAPLDNAVSLKSASISSLLCVPITSCEELFGLLYLDTTDPKTTFEESDLQLVTGVAAIVGIAIKNLRWAERLEEENAGLLEEVGIAHDMVGESTPIQRVLTTISKVAPADSTALICGESGSGKELVARAIHRNSSRAKNAFVAINCAALAEPLLESELFGHEKGAFTGAILQKKGKFEVAHEGTVFLDEISEISLPLQAKLLRVLQEREFERVGGTKTIKVDIRVIAATNQNLEEAIKRNLFRQDLYFRLNVINIPVPPLRERKDDIPLLANYFVLKLGKKFNRRVRGISPSAHQYLMRYDWPGNVRELENAIERAIVLGNSDWISVEDLPEQVLETECPSGVSPITYHEGIKEAKKTLVSRALEQTQGNAQEAARILGVHPHYLYRLIHNLHLGVPKKD